MTSLIEMVVAGQALDAEAMAHDPKVLLELERFIKHIRCREIGDHGEVAFVLHRLSGRSMEEISAIMQDHHPHLTRERLHNIKGICSRLASISEDRATIGRSP